MKKRKTQHERDWETALKATAVASFARFAIALEHGRFRGCGMVGEFVAEDALARILNRALAAHRKGKRDGK